MPPEHQYRLRWVDVFTERALAGNPLAVVLDPQGLTAEQIVEQYPQRSLREIYAVLAWYYEHQADFDRELAEEDAQYDALARQFGQRP